MAGKAGMGAFGSPTFGQNAGVTKTPEANTNGGYGFQTSNGGTLLNSSQEALAEVTGQPAYYGGPPRAGSPGAAGGIAHPEYYGDPLNTNAPWQPYIYGGGYGGLKSELGRVFGAGQRREDTANALATGAVDQSGRFLSQTGEDRTQTQDALGRLRGFYEQGPGPSAAEQQLRMGANQSMGNALALARSGRGAGGGGIAMRNAGFQNAATMQQTNAQAALMRAQEAQNWRQQQLGAMGLEQGTLANMRGQDLQGGLGFGQLGQGYLAQGNQAGQFADSLRHQILGGQLQSEMQGYGAEMGYQSRQDNQSPWWLGPTTAIAATGATIAAPYLAPVTAPIAAKGMSDTVKQYG
jgi:hypothetical protein